MRRLKLALLLWIAGNCTQFLSAEDSDFFEKRVRPLLATQCYSCHGPEKQFSALRLDSRHHILAGGRSGPAAVPGSPDESLFIKAVRHQGLKMPLGSKLKADEIAALEKWVREGLPWPEEKADKPLVSSGSNFYEKAIREHWAFQPVKAVRPVEIPGSAATANPIDLFISAKLQQNELQLAPEAERRVLARRLAYVLTGLPPARADLLNFLNDRSSSAYESFVDKLLARPQFGERWARHWLDLMRFAETYGYEWNFEINGAWRYRDYLIRAFNSDLRYDQLIREHIAGDLLDRPRTRDNGALNESILGTASFRLGEMGHDDCIEFRELRTDVVDNQIDTLTKAFQGLTVSCARCHDHKIDPIPTEDYYSLYGILNSSRPVTRTLNVGDPNESGRSRLLELKSRVRRETASAWLRETASLGRYIQAALGWQQDSSEAAKLAEGLDPLRVSLWLKLLKRDKVGMHDPLYPLMEAAKSKHEPIKWSELTARYEKETIEREEFNRAKFVPFGNFQTTIPAGWSADGLGLRDGFASSGDFAIATQGSNVVNGVFPKGLFTNLVSDRMNGVLRTPMLPKDKKFLSLQVVGDKLGAYRKIIDHCVIGEDHRFVSSDSLKWVKISTHGATNSSGVETVTANLPIYVELSTVADNPRLPERPEKFKDLTDEMVQAGRSYFGITRAVLHDGDEAPKEDLRHLAPLLAGAPAKDDAELAKRFEAIVHRALQAWHDGTASDQDTVWIDWLIREGAITNSRNLTPALRSLTDQYREAEASLQQPTVTYSMGDLDRGWDTPILVGGAAGNPGKIAPRHFLALMPEALRRVNTEQSGRRELAEAIASPENPLTARVMVNRIWHHVFGRGIVGTTDNFGRYGDSPTHPELLDYLANRFTEEGWSTKKLIRLMVTSRTFQQTSLASPSAAAADPENLLWSHYPVRRLDAESVRDTILAVSGRLDKSLYGPSIDPHRGELKANRRLFQGPLDGKGRRSIYLKVTRMDGPRFLELFDFPLPIQTRGNRDVTNVPSQALAMLNDPFVIDQARVWADRLILRKDDALHARLAEMFEEALGRPPSSEEIERWRTFTLALADRNSVPADELLRDQTVWKNVAHSFFSMKELLYLR